MSTFVVGAGHVNENFIKTIIGAQDENQRTIIACDRGVEVCLRMGVIPDYCIGDFDSASEGTYEKALSLGIPVTKLNPIKDDTDSEAALNLAVEKGTGDIVFLGGTGSRLDHVLGNISVLGNFNRKVFLLDETNRIQMLKAGELLELDKANQYGKYVSVFPFMGTVKGLTMKGFKYPLENEDILGFNTLTVSNEIVDAKAVISFEEGHLIVMETKD